MSSRHHAGSLVFEKLHQIVGGTSSLTDCLLVLLSDGQRSSKSESHFAFELNSCLPVHSLFIHYSKQVLTTHQTTSPLDNLCTIQLDQSVLLYHTATSKG